MMLVKAVDLYMERNGVTLFEKVSLEIREGERLALIGRNGVGKTTLLQVLLGKAEPGGGQINRIMALEEWGSLAQQADADCGLTVLEYVLSSRVELYSLRERLRALEEQLGQEGTSSESVLDAYSELLDKYSAQGGYDWELQAERSLKQLGLDRPLWELPLSALSGGQKTRAQLAAAIVREPRFMMLDEPTNHLDEAALHWLEQWMAAYRGTILYVSHDRAFIDRTATAVLELSPTGCRRYPGGYSDFIAQKELERRTLEQQVKKQEQEREKLLASIRRYAEWFQQAHRAAGQNDFLRSKSKKNVSRMHAKEAALEQLDRSKAQLPKEPAPLKLKLEAEGSLASTLLRMEEVSFAYDGGSPLFQGLSLSINRGDRLAVIAPNGSGKTTLLKLAASALSPLSGSVTVNPQTRIGYFEQELRLLKSGETLLDSLLALPNMTQSEARTILGCFLFRKDDVYKRISELSMGEKCRAAFLRLYFGKANLLIIDEPTNYLDVETREQIEESLLHYPGAVMLVTHDQYFVRRAANRLLLLDGSGGCTLYDGGYDEYVSAGPERVLKPLSAEAQALHNDREAVRLRLTQLMCSPEPMGEQEREEILNEIRHLRSQLE